MSRCKFDFVIIICCAFLSALAAESAQATERPNIVLIWVILTWDASAVR
ncbi:MAG: hypothetical protein ACPHJ3_14460 [Rubripirellula sp.]